jgi:tetratricopeptide (TPR) repeat protein
MYYFFACHFEGRNDRAKQREYLDKGVAVDPTDVDVLIARYRLPDQTAEYRQETLKLIKEGAAKFRQQITHAPDSATPYNQFAWLVANTEGDLDVALKYSLKSIQLSPTSGGFHDTLAHVYYARGDYENAVKTQTKAAQMEPHTKMIARQLEVFRKKLEETKKKDGETPGKPNG